MNEDLKFHFPIANLQRDGDAILTAAEAHAEVEARLPAGYLEQARGYLDAVTTGDAAAKGKKGGVGTLTKEQNVLLAKLNKWITASRKTAGLAWPTEAVKLREEFQVGVNEPSGLPDVVRRGRIILASVKVPANLAVLKAKGWADADTVAFETAISGLAATDTTQEKGKGDAKGATGLRNREANQLYEALLTIQNAADLQWPEDMAANVAVRAEFRLGQFPPRGGNNKKPDAPTPTPPPAA